MNRVPFEIGGYYHIFNRGTDKRDIFLDDKDRDLFLMYMRVLNDNEVESPRLKLQGSTLLNTKIKMPLVNIVAFSLMTNHFHFLVQEIVNAGISKYMQRLGTAYTMYFNEKIDRSGSLFQGRYKAKVIDDEKYLSHVIDYIHLNPLDIVSPDWEEKGLKDVKGNMEFLERYKWSSLGEAIGISDSGIIKSELLKTEIGSPENYRKHISEWHIGERDLVREYLF